MEPNRLLSKLGVLAAVLMIAAVMAPVGSSAAGHAAKRFYVSRKPALKVELTIYKHHVFRASVLAPGTCSNGEPSNAIGFGITGGSGLPIRGHAHRFNDTVVGTNRSLTFRGRVEGNKVVGLFTQMFREEPPQEGGKEELPGPQCGNGSSPKGEVVHFVAPQVGEKHVPPWMR